MNLWHTKKTGEVFEELKTTESGLSSEEASTRLKQFGENKLDEGKKHGIVYKFLMQFKNVMVIVLLAAAVVSAAIAIFNHEFSELIDSGIILAIVLINAIIGVIQENKAEQSLQALQDMSKPYAKVKRNGRVEKIVTTDVVVGDIVILEAGDVVPCDMRLIESASLKIEEAALTGESLPSEKTVAVIENEKAPLGDRGNMAFASSVVTYGRGEGVAVATGMNAEMGKIARMLKEEKSDQTPLQRKIDKTGKMISIAVLAIAFVIFVVSVLKSDGFALGPVLDAFMTAVAIAVAAIPEGLPACITIIMAIGVQKMSKRRAIIRKLPAVETLGSTEIICSDKTGTLTLNQMTVQRVCTANSVYEGQTGSGNEYETIINCMVLCNDTNASIENDGMKTVGDPTETALIQYAYKHGFNKIEMDKKYTRVNEIPFDADRKLMSTVNVQNGKNVSFTKGAPDMLLKRCNKILDGGNVRALTQDDKKRIEKENSIMAHKALRVLAFAIKTENLQDIKELEKDLVYVGLVGMIDPPREEVKHAVKTCKRAGMRAIMITGDHRDTAYAIASELGIANSEEEVITGAMLDEMTDIDLFDSVEKYRVYARVSPEHKVRIVKAWKGKGKIVAMTGDGVNDAPSIKAADIGIGMGITGTDVTKGAADMVLADDNFATIVYAVEEGRKIYNNIQKTVQFLLSANVAEVLSLFLATLFFPPEVPFLLAIQILWINLITDSLPALALGVEPAETDLMSQPPRKGQSNLFAGRVGINIFYQGLVQTVLVFGIYVFATFYWDNNHHIAMTMAFITLSLIQLFHCFNARSLDQSIFKCGLFKNKFMWVSFGVGLGLTLAVTLIPPFQTIFELVDLTWVQWLMSVGTAFLIVPIVEVVKLITRSIRRSKDKKIENVSVS